MADMISQAEIEALLNGGSTPENGDPGEKKASDDASVAANVPADGIADAGLTADQSPAADTGSKTETGDSKDTPAGGDEPEADDLFAPGEDPTSVFTIEEVDALGEVGNISMGNSATTLFALLNRKVDITTPQVSVSTLRQVADTYVAPLVVVKVEYTEGFLGSNLLVLKEYDVMVITDLMMGGDGQNIQGEITDLHLSAISEAMNQMIGNSSTSLSNVFETKIDISPPEAISVKIGKSDTLIDIIELDPQEKVAVVSFHMTVENLLNTKIMQILPLQFAKEMISKLVEANKPENKHTPDVSSQQNSAPSPQAVPPAQQPQYVQAQPMPQYAPQPQYAPPQPQYAPPPQYAAQPPQYVNVQPANFQAFDEEQMVFDRKNIGLVMDVQLEVSVELGRTHRLIKDILEFGQGSIIELDRLAGEPVDILVNGKPIAKGEVVVIDESFGVRVTDIIHPSKRL